MSTFSLYHTLYSLSALYEKNRSLRRQRGVAAQVFFFLHCPPSCATYPLFPSTSLPPLLPFRFLTPIPPPGFLLSHPVYASHHTIHGPGASIWCQLSFVSTADPETQACSPSSDRPTKERSVTLASFRVKPGSSACAAAGESGKCSIGHMALVCLIKSIGPSTVLIFTFTHVHKPLTWSSKCTYLAPFEGEVRQQQTHAAIRAGHAPDSTRLYGSDGEKLVVFPSLLDNPMRNEQGGKRRDHPKRISFQRERKTPRHQANWTRSWATSDNKQTVVNNLLHLLGTNERKEQKTRKPKQHLEPKSPQKTNRGRAVSGCGEEGFRARRIHELPFDRPAARAWHRMLVFKGRPALGSLAQTRIKVWGRTRPPYEKERLPGRVPLPPCLVILSTHGLASPSTERPCHDAATERSVLGVLRCPGS